MSYMVSSLQTNSLTLVYVQTLAQNIVSHKRNFKGLVEIFEKAGAVFQRMQCLEKNIQKNMQDLDAMMTLEDNSNMEKMKEMVYETMNEVEKSAKEEMRDSIEPVATYLLRKKMDGELDDFISHILTYVEQNP